MKVLIDTKTNYNNLNGQRLEVIRAGEKTVTCLVPKELDPLYGQRSCFDKEVDFSKEEVVLVEKFRRSLLGMIAMGLNAVGQNPEEVISYIEEELFPSEIETVLDYVKYYISDKNKEVDQEKAYENFLQEY